MQDMGSSKIYDISDAENCFCAGFVNGVEAALNMSNLTIDKEQIEQLINVGSEIFFEYYNNISSKD